MQTSWTKNAFSDENNKKWHKWWKFISPFSYNNTYGLPVLTIYTRCPNQVYLIFDWPFYRICVLNTGWKRDSHQLMIFVNVCSTWSKVELNTRFETWITIVTRLLFNNTYGLPVLTMDTKCPNQEFYVWLFDLQIICAKYRLETSLSPCDDIRKY
jgi:hypothetical protein